jgi:hypothetical protein
MSRRVSIEIPEVDCRAIISDIRRSRQPVSFWQRWILSLTYPLWRPIISRVFYDLYQHRVIDSSRLHLLSCFFDKTQQDSCLIFLKPKR